MVINTPTLENKIKIILFSILLVIFSSASLSISIGIFSILIKNEFVLQLCTLLSFIISFIIIPILFIKLFKLNSVEGLSINVNKCLLIFLCFIFMSFITKDYLIKFYFLCVAIGEEYLFRHIIYKILSKEFNIVLISIIGSILFAFLLHLNEPFLINLINRFPSSIILYFIRYNINLSFSIITHWIYNLLLTYLG